jgi:hypothetical protein
MKKSPQTLSMISVLMIFTLMAEISGCAGYQVIPTASLPDYNHYSHMVYGRESNYLLDSTEISDGILSGVTKPDGSRARNAVRVYPLSASDIRLDSGNILYLPCDRIGKVKVPQILVPRENVYPGSSKKPREKKELTGTDFLRGLYYIGGLMITGSLAWWIFEQKRR